MKRIFHDRNKELENEIELYLCSLSNATLIFAEGLKDYVKNNPEKFQQRIAEVVGMEKRADEQLKNIKFKLYKYNLIPDLCSDILELMDALDDIADISKQVLIKLSIEKPKILDYLNEDLIEIAEISLKAVEQLVSGVRVFFTQIKVVEEYTNRVYFYEAEADRAEELLERKIFNDENISLCEKMHLRYFVEKIVSLSDAAEKIAIMLGVFKFKRSI